MYQTIQLFISSTVLIQLENDNKLIKIQNFEPYF